MIYGIGCGLFDYTHTLFFIHIIPTIFYSQLSFMIPPSVELVPLVH